jgi:hypothetical protein
MFCVSSIRIETGFELGRKKGAGPCRTSWHPAVPAASAIKFDNGKLYSSAQPQPIVVIAVKQVSSSPRTMSTDLQWLLLRVRTDLPQPTDIN